MPTFDESWSGRLRKVGDLERPDHWHIAADDNCLFFGEYTARAGYGHSSTNQLVLNLKKKPELAGTPQYVWKGRAIDTIGAAIRANLRADRMGDIAFVPIPPSKPPGSPGYDDRMAQVARAIGPTVDVREVLVTTVPREAAHVQQAHRDRDELRASLAVVPELVGRAPPLTILLDDVLTMGCSFKVCQDLVKEIWPETSVLGVFVARRALEKFDPTVEFGDLALTSDQLWCSRFQASLRPQIVCRQPVRQHGLSGPDFAWRSLCISIQCRGRFGHLDLKLAPLPGVA